MKLFVQKEFKLRDLNAGMKIITTSFLFLALAGYLTGFLLGTLKAGMGIQALVDYYRGNETLMIYPKSALELLEVSHFHLFSVPVVFMIVGHLMMMTYIKFRLRVLMILLGFAGMILDLASPWLIRYCSGSFVWVKVIGSGAFGISFLGMILIEFYELFFRKEPFEL